MSRSSFIPCSYCKRHFRGSEPICPFCFARRAGSTMAMAVALGGAIGGCRDASPPNGSTTTVPSASEGESTPASKTDIAPTSSSDGDAGNKLALSPPRPVYGPAAQFPGDRIPGLKGAIAITPVTATVPVPNADKLIAIAQPALRTCYQSGLRREPTMTGTLKVTMTVDTSGTVTNITSDGPLAAPVQACMKDRLKGIKFDAPSKESTLTTEISCTSTHD